MNFLINSLVKYIGYPLASMLVEKLIFAVRSIYTERILENAENSRAINDGERHALTRAISKANTNEDRKNLSLLLSKLSSLDKLPDTDG